VARRAGRSIEQVAKMCCMEAGLVADQDQHVAGGAEVRRCQPETAADAQRGRGILYLDGAQSAQFRTESGALRRHDDQDIRICFRGQPRRTPQQ